MEVDKNGEEVTIDEIILKPKIYGEIKEILDYHFRVIPKNERYKNPFPIINDVVDRCIIVYLFERYGNITEISSKTNIHNSVINNALKRTGLESLYSSSHVGGREVK